MLVDDVREPGPVFLLCHVVKDLAHEDGGGEARVVRCGDAALVAKLGHLASYVQELHHACGEGGGVTRVVVVGLQEWWGWSHKGSLAEWR